MVYYRQFVGLHVKTTVAVHLFNDTIIIELRELVGKQTTGIPQNERKSCENKSVGPQVNHMVK